MNTDLDISPLAQKLSESSIRTIANYGMTLPDVIPLWFGESDIPTPKFISEAAIASLNRDETRYTPNNGLPQLRTALADYSTRLFARPIADNNIVVTVSGTDALMLACQTCISHGDKVVVITPVFPTLFAIPELLGAEVVPFALEQKENRFELNLEALFAQAKDARAIIINSPNNPTGWMASQQEIHAIMAFAREHGVWVVSDEVYSRHCYEDETAPSFVKEMQADDKLIICNSFSKAWCMTGWRLGWLTLPENYTPTITKLIEFNVSCAPAFVQHGGLAAITQGEEFVNHTLDRFRQGRSLVQKYLGDIEGVTLYDMPATFYAFLKVRGLDDNSQPAILEMIEKYRVGVAPGEAFGSAGSGHLRICYGSHPDKLEKGLAGIREFLTEFVTRSLKV